MRNNTKIVDDLNQELHLLDINELRQLRQAVLQLAALIDDRLSRLDQSDDPQAGFLTDPVDESAVERHLHPNGSSGGDPASSLDRRAQPDAPQAGEAGAGIEPATSSL